MNHAPLPAWLHVLCWWAVIVLLVVTVMLTGRALQSSLVHGQTVDLETWLLCAASFVALTTVLLFWGANVYLPSALARLVKDRDGVDFEYRPPWCSALIGDARLLVRLDHPFFGYVPIAGTKPGVATDNDRLHPMFRTGEANLFLLSKQVELPAALITVRANDEPMVHDRPVPAWLLVALSDATKRLDPDILPGVNVYVQTRWIRFSAPGGSWLGARFGKRIEALLLFSQDVRVSIEGLFAIADGSLYEVRPTDQDFILSLWKG